MGRRRTLRAVHTSNPTRAEYTPAPGPKVNGITMSDVIREAPKNWQTMGYGSELLDIQHNEDGSVFLRITNKRKGTKACAILLLPRQVAELKGVL